MIKKENKGLVYFQFERFSRQKTTNHFISTRINGKFNEFNLSLYNRTNKEEIIRRRQMFADLLNVPFANFVFQQQIHSRNVKIITKADIGKGAFKYYEGIFDNDAMITNEANICLNVMAGDCVPLLFLDPVKKVVGVVHAGWRGTYKQIAKHTVQEMQNNYSCVPSNILVGIGPSISQKNYEVDDKVYRKFEKIFDNLAPFFRAGDKKGKYYLDLWEANKQQLISAGLKEENIELANICTFEQNDLFFSARKGDEGRFMGGIMLV